MKIHNTPNNTLEPHIPKDGEVFQLSINQRDRNSAGKIYRRVGDAMDELSE